MLKQFCKDMKLGYSAQVLCLSATVLAFLAGFAVVCIIMVADTTSTTWFCMGTLFALIMLPFASVLAGIGYRHDFALALSMGRTRKEFMFSYALRHLISIVASYLLILALYHIEVAACGALFPTKPCEIYFTFLTEWWFLLLIPLLVIFSMFIGALYSRFGKRFMVILYFLWLFGCFVLPHLVPDEHTESSLFVLLVSVLPLTWLLLGTVAAVAMVIAVLHLGRKQMVH